jgi:hypothetical protein
MIPIIKYISRILIVTVLLSIGPGCTDFLDKTPVDVITNELILTDNAAFTAHLAYLYSQIPFENFETTFWWFGSYYTGEMVYCQQDAGTNMDFTYGTWVSGSTVWSLNYNLIRALNNLINNFGDATAFPSETAKANALGELRFMRAYVYFSLAQRYGGVPLITEVSDLPESGDITSLRVPRSKAADVYSFIETEMTEAISKMSATDNKYRFNKWSGLAYKSRAMLYAASIAKYETVQLDGLIGIPASQAQHYFEAARDAANQLITTGPYALYNVYPADQVKNYHQLFMDETAANKERILVNAFLYPTKGHRFDLYAAPFSHRGGEGYGGRFCPTYEMVEDYEYVDNRNGTLKLNDGGGAPIQYADPATLFNGKDPRFFASVAYPGATWRSGIKLQIWGNTISGGVLTGAGGADGLLATECTSTSFYLTKWADLEFKRTINTTSSDVDRMMIRYAEVLLNYAEAQFELGQTGPALTYVNMIRSRAGIQELTSLTLDDLRHERKIELAYEGNYYWDLKRWRVYHSLFLNTPTHCLFPINNKDLNVFTFEKQKLPDNKFTRTFETKFYYYAIDAAAIAANPLLVQNPGR